MIVLRADDNGQGGAFALFSLLKRQAELGKKSKVRSLNFLQKGPPVANSALPWGIQITQIWHPVVA